MEFSSAFKGRERQIADLFTAAFTESEGPAEGRLIGNLARALLRDTARDDLFVFSAWTEGMPVGGIVFSRLIYELDGRNVFVLGPVAVATDCQGRGIGRRLLRHGLTALRNAGVDIAVTYGDPAYYAAVGFAPIAETFARAPFELSRPEGWLAHPLAAGEMTPLKGPARCVAALNDPVFW